MDERQAVLKSVLMLDHMPAGMELFPATDDAAWQLICDVIDASDYYLLVLGGRYGSMDEEGIGFTEKEYEYASSKGIPVVPFLHRNPDNLPRDKTETKPGAWRKLSAFRKKVEDAHTCSYWESPDELKAQVVLGLTATVKRTPRQGWIRAGKLASDEAAQKILDLQQRIAEQKEQLERLSHAPPVGTEYLAQGDDLLEVEFKVTYTLPGTGYHNPDRTIRERFVREVTWKEIFGAIAPNLTEPQRETKVRSDLARFFRERFDEEISKLHEDRTPATATIGENLLQTVRVQLSALGLIEAQQLVIKGEHGKEREARFVELTPYGRSELIRVRAIYRSEAGAVDR